MAGSADRQLKKLNGAAFDNAVFARDGGDQRDRARHHGADQQLIAFARGEGGEVERDGFSQMRSWVSPWRWVSACAGPRPSLSA
jgi:hypothetical protein